MKQTEHKRDEKTVFYRNTDNTYSCFCMNVEHAEHVEKLIARFGATIAIQDRPMQHGGFEIIISGDDIHSVMGCGYKVITPSFTDEDAHLATYIDNEHFCKKLVNKLEKRGMTVQVTPIPVGEDTTYKLEVERKDANTLLAIGYKVERSKDKSRGMGI